GEILLNRMRWNTQAAATVSGRDLANRSESGQTHRQGRQSGHGPRVEPRVLRSVQPQSHLIEISLIPGSGLYYSLEEDDARSILAHPMPMIGSDGLHYEKIIHPRLWGTFPRVLGHYARDLGLVFARGRDSPHDQLAG